VRLNRAPSQGIVTLADAGVQGVAASQNVVMPDPIRHPYVTPAKSGVRGFALFGHSVLDRSSSDGYASFWIPAFAGMTTRAGSDTGFHRYAIL
jgi:hypothetical protein